MTTPRSATFTAATAGAALLGFALNSLLCRMALAPGLIDALSFTAVRLAAGAVTLGLLARATGSPAWEGNAVSGAVLLVYAVPFSLAYLRLTAGTGALLLFGCVQATMIGWSVVRGQHPRPAEWLGLAVSLLGLLVLVLPSLTSPPPGSAALMATAGICWASYSLRGRGSKNPLSANAGNFLWAAPGAVAIALGSLALGNAHFTARGVAYAIASGAVASGVGYALWYTALRGLTATRAAILQLSVPVIAASGGIVLLGEKLSPRLLLAGGTILVGVALALLGGRSAGGSAPATPAASTPDAGPEAVRSRG